MTRPHDLAADLPPPNPDEPASLRQDIVDELADHLACAARQEALRAELDTDGETPDEQAIAEAVLARFGDPRRIARRLWFDAMKGRLMMQKLTAAFAAIAAVGAIAGCVLLWTALDATRSTLAEAIAENRKDRQASEDANRAVLAQLAKLQTDAKKPPRSLEWNPLRVKLVLGSRGQKPAVGYSVTLNGKPYGNEKQEVHKKSTAAGIADFGLVRPGSYSAIIRTPWNFRFFEEINVTPGSDAELSYYVPETEVVKTQVKLQLRLPEDLRKHGITTFIQFHRPIQKIPGAARTFTHSAAPLVVHILNEKTQHYLYERASNVSRGSRYLEPFFGTLSLREYESIPPTERRTASWLTAEYGIEQILLLLPSNERHPSSSRDTYETYYVVDRVYFEKPETFTPEPRKQNLWKITLPPKLIESARKRLNAWNEGLPATPLSAASAEFIKKLVSSGTGFDNLTDEQKRDYVTRVRYYFSVMDTNNDGRLRQSEWNPSKRIKPAFEKAKIDLTKDMTEIEFVRHYIRIFPDPSWKQPSPAKKTSKK